MRFQSFFSIFLLFFSFFIFSKEMTILHMNDTHGYAWPNTLLPDKNFGGFAAMATLVNEIRAKEKRVLLFHAGDFNTGDPASDMFFAKPDIQALNFMDLTAMTLGNHEFDNKREVLMEQRKWAEFPLISCNIYKKGEKNSLFAPYIVKKIDGIKVAILGVLTRETTITASPLNIGDLVIKDPISEVKKYRKIIKKEEDPDIIIVLAHLGFHKKEESLFVGSLQLAESQSGLVIVDGHSHSVFEKPLVVNNSIIVQAGFHGRYLGKLKLDIKDKKVVSINGKLIPINLNGTPRIKEDIKVKKMLSYYRNKVEDILNQPLARSEIDLPMKGVQEGENLLVQVITDSMKDYVGTDIAFINAGGIRNEIRKGDIALVDVKKVLPFTNKIFTLKMKGYEILKLLEYAASLPLKSKGRLHLSGLKWTNNKGKVENVSIGGAKIKKNKLYSVTTLDYLISGGDGYKILMNSGRDYKNQGILISDAFAEYLKKLKVLKKENIILEKRNIIIK